MISSPTAVIQTLEGTEHRKHISLVPEVRVFLFFNPGQEKSKEEMKDFQKEAVLLQVLPPSSQDWRRDTSTQIVINN